MIKVTVHIIQKYLIRQVFGTTAVVTALLTFIMVGTRSVKYFGLAAQGRMDIHVLLSIVGYRLPDFLILIVPLSLFIGVMLVFGRLYVDHEMAIFNSSGVSRGQLGWQLWPLVLLLILVEALLTLQVGPWGTRESYVLFASQAVRSGFDMVKPGEFLSSGPYTIYADNLSDDRRELHNVFIYQRPDKPGAMDRLILAQKASRVTDPTQQASIIDLVNGRQYQALPHSLKYNHVEFSYYRLRIAHDATSQTITDLETRSTPLLLTQQHQAPSRAELGWRLVMPWVIALAVLLALPLSSVSPRQGRFLKLFPAIVMFASVVVLLIAVKTRVGKNQLSPLFFVIVLLGYTGFAVWLNYWPKIQQRLASRSPAS